MSRIHQLKLNPPQLRAMLALAWAKIIYLIWSRGTGKSFFIAWFMIMVSRQMPRSKWNFLGPTYKTLLTDILPGIVDALERLGYKQGIHFLVQKPPLKAWPTAYQAPLTYDYAIAWYNGTVFCLLSQDRNTSSGRGLSSDGIIMDEALKIKKDRLDKDVMPTNRGNLDRFGKCPLHHSILVCSSMPFSLDGRWILDLIDKAENDPSIFVDLANIFENLDNVGMEYIQTLQKSTLPINFLIEVLNIRMNQITDGFYSGLNEKIHGYDEVNPYDIMDGIEFNILRKMKLTSIFDGDCDRNRALDVGVDWGANISSAVIAQDHGNKIRFLRNMYVKWPDLIKALARKIIDHYSTHIYKVIRLYPGHEGAYRKADTSESYVDQFVKELEAAGWIVHVIRAPMPKTYHQDKYLLWHNILHSVTGYPEFEINKTNCKETLRSMQLAPAKQGSQGIEKDKKSEKTGEKQEEATHLSDAGDMIVWGKYYNKLVVEDVWVPNRYS